MIIKLGLLSIVINMLKKNITGVHLETKQIYILYLKIYQIF